MPNYGDVALGLTAAWSRNNYDNQEFLMGTVGHENGVADAYLKDAPEARHQFYFADPKDQKDISTMQMRGYVFVQKDVWVKHPILWGDWDAQGHINYGGTNLMARPEALYLADQTRRAKLSTRVRAEADADVRTVPNGLVATDENGDAMVRRKARGVRI